MTTARAINLFNPAFLNTFPLSYYTVPVSKQCCILKKLTLCNTSITSNSVSVYLVPQSGGASNENIVISNRNLEPNETLDVFEITSHVLPTGASLQLLASSSDVVSARGAGVEVSA